MTHSSVLSHSVIIGTDFTTHTPTQSQSTKHPRSLTWTLRDDPQKRPCGGHVVAVAAATSCGWDAAGEMWRRNRHSSSPTSSSSLNITLTSLTCRQEEVSRGNQIRPILPSPSSPSLAAAPCCLPALPQPAAPLAVRAVPHEAVAPHELLAAAEAVVRLEARVRLHVLREVMLHLELLGTDGAVERPQVQVHVNVPIPHALVGERLTTVAHKHFPRTPSAAVAAAAATPDPPAVHAIDSQTALQRQLDRTVLQTGTFERRCSYHTTCHP